MADESNMVPEEGKNEGRRDFVKTSAQVAVTAPAVAMLLKASVRPARAVVSGIVAFHSHILDDFTFGNEHEDIDAIETGNNFNFRDGKPQQDDHV
jgi:hypothetical protein